MSLLRPSAGMKHHKESIIHEKILVRPKIVPWPLNISCEVTVNNDIKPFLTYFAK